MDSTAWIALAIFMVVYVFIVSEKIHRTVIALTGAMLMIVCGILTQEMAIHHIDFNTIGLLAGMMVVVNITGETGLFNYLAVWSAKKVKAEPLKLLVALSFLTAICSAFLDNVTTVLLTVPLTFSITRQLNVPVKPFLVAQILASNIGGTSTLIGDPPNIMIGSAVPEMDFMAFITNLSGVCIVTFIVTIKSKSNGYGRTPRNQRCYIAQKMLSSISYDHHYIHNACSIAFRVCNSSTHRCMYFDAHQYG